MGSRYDLMEKSSVKGTDGTYYKDPLTFSEKEIRITEDPVEYPLRSIDIERFDLFVAKTYGGYNIYKDLILQYNVQEYQWDYNSEDVMLIPNKQEFDRYIRKNRV